jgi:hypothetical protein
VLLTDPTARAVFNAESGRVVLSLWRAGAEGAVLVELSPETALELVDDLLRARAAARWHAETADNVGKSHIKPAPTPQRAEPATTRSTFSLNLPRIPEPSPCQP